MSSAKVNIWLQNESWEYTVDVYEKQRRIKKGILMNSSVHVGVTGLMRRFNIYSVYYEYGMIQTTFQLCLESNNYPVLTATCHYSQNQKIWQSQDSLTTWVLRHYRIIYFYEVEQVINTQDIQIYSVKYCKHFTKTELYIIFTHKKKSSTE
jgi:hypothetical protein